MSYSKTLAKGMIIFMGAMLLTKILGYGYKIILSRWLGANDFGLFSLALAFFTLLSGVMVSGIHLSLSRYIAYHRGKKDVGKITNGITGGMQLVIVMNVIAGILVYIFAAQIAQLLNHGEIASLLRVFAWMFPFYGILLTLQKIFEGYQRIDLSTTTDLVLNILRLVFLAGAIAISATLVNATISYVAATAVVVLGIWFIAEKKVISFTKKLFSYNPKNMQEIISVSWPLMIAVIVHIVMTWSDTLILGFFRTAREVGIYNIATPTANLLTLPVFALTTVFLPFVSNLFAKGEMRNMIKLYKTATKWILLISIPLLLVIILFPERIIHSTAGAGYEEGYQALAILAWGVFIYALATPANMMLLSLNKTRFMMKNSIFAFIASVALNILLIPRYGMNGAAWAFVGSSFIISVLRIIEVKQVIKTKMITKKMVVAVFAGIIAAAVAYVTDPWLGSFIGFDFVRLCVNAGMIGIVYLSLLYIGKCFDEEDKEIVKAIFARLTRKKN